MTVGASVLAGPDILWTGEQLVSCIVCGDERAAHVSPTVGTDRVRRFGRGALWAGLQFDRLLQVCRPTLAGSGV